MAGERDARATALKTPCYKRRPINGAGTVIKMLRS